MNYKKVARKAASLVAEPIFYGEDKKNKTSAGKAAGATKTAKSGAAYSKRRVTPDEKKPKTAKTASTTSSVRRSSSTQGVTRDANAGSKKGVGSGVHSGRVLHGGAAAKPTPTTRSGRVSRKKKES